MYQLEIFSMLEGSIVKTEKYEGHDEAIEAMEAYDKDPHTLVKLREIPSDIDVMEDT